MPQIHGGIPLPEHVEAEYVSTAAGVARDKEETAAGEGAVEGGESAEDEGGGFECVGVDMRS